MAGRLGAGQEPVHFLQIWIEPKSRGTAPSYEQLKFAPEEKHNRFRVLASSAKVEGAATLNQDASVAVAEMTPGTRLTHELAAGRHAWLHVIHGDVTVNGTKLATGDAVAADEETKLEIAAETGSEVLLFDLA